MKQCTQSSGYQLPYNVYHTGWQSWVMALHPKSWIPKTLFLQRSCFPFPPVARPRCGSDKQCSGEGAHMRPRSNNTNVSLDASGRVGLPTMRGMTRIKIGGRYETRCCYKTLRNPRAGELLQQPPPTVWVLFCIWPQSSSGFNFLGEFGIK